MREAVYQRARAALARQLTAVDPPLPTREIEAQHQQLEHAIGAIEQDYAPPPVEEPPPRPPEAPRPENGAGSYLRSENGAAKAPAPRAAPPPPQPEPDYDLPREEADDYDSETGPDYEDEEPSRAPALIVLAVLAVLVIGGGALLYSQRDTLAGLVGMSSEPQQAEVVPAPSEPQPAEAAAGELPAADPLAELAAEADKRPDRLANGEAAGQADVAQVQPPPAIPEAQPPAPPAQTPAAAPPAGQSVVAQRAIYYEQGSDGAPGAAFQGTVSWSEVPRDGNTRAIQAVLQVPEQNVTVTVSISKNVDQSLPASHLVEVEFSGQGTLSDTAVERVPALVLKPNEQARGQPLSGAAVPVTENLFWIALSSEDEQVQRNISLLREGSWFDLPILFADGKRALLTFEKGIPGDKVFETVIASWTQP
jgi:hypothetical protein